MCVSAEQHARLHRHEGDEHRVEHAERQRPFPSPDRSHRGRSHLVEPRPEPDQVAALQDEGHHDRGHHESRGDVATVELRHHVVDQVRERRVGGGEQPTEDKGQDNSDADDDRSPSELGDSDAACGRSAKGTT
jgi:hypothetical protein